MSNESGGLFFAVQRFNEAIQQGVSGENQYFKIVQVKSCLPRIPDIYRELQTSYAQIDVAHPHPNMYIAPAGTPLHLILKRQPLPKYGTCICYQAHHQLRIAQAVRQPGRDGYQEHVMAAGNQLSQRTVKGRAVRLVGTKPDGCSAPVHGIVGEMRVLVGPESLGMLKIVSAVVNRLVLAGAVGCAGKTVKF